MVTRTHNTDILHFDTCQPRRCRMVGEHRICGILIANLIKCAAGPQHRREGQLRRYQQGVIN